MRQKSCDWAMKFTPQASMMTLKTFSRDPGQLFCHPVKLGFTCMKGFVSFKGALSCCFGSKFECHLLKPQTCNLPSLTFMPTKLSVLLAPMTPVGGFGDKICVSLLFQICSKICKKKIKSKVWSKSDKLWDSLQHELHEWHPLREKGPRRRNFSARTVKVPVSCRCFFTIFNFHITSFFNFVQLLAQPLWTGSGFTWLQEHGL